MAQPPQRSWWGRNWKWVVPVGCLLPLVGCCGFFSILFLVVTGAIKSSDVYKDALTRAQANDEVRAALGEPIAAGFWTTGNIEVSGSSGKADLSIPIKGPKGSATLYAVATKTAGKWEYSNLEVRVLDSATRIDLLEKERPVPQSPPRATPPKR